MHGCIGRQSSSQGGVDRRHTPFRAKRALSPVGVDVNSLNNIVIKINKVSVNKKERFSS